MLGFDRLKTKKIHFLGIGGSGMYPLAQILFNQGYEITGSDNNPSGTLDAVKSMGITVNMGHKAENIGDAGLVVYTAAVFEDNPELVEAHRRGIPTMPRAELLGIIADSFNCAAAVCGTHGKTTSTSMLTEVFLSAGKDPSAVIGGKLASIGGSGRVGSTEYMTCEACEFRDTFLHIHPAYSLILNVDEDHLEYFKNLQNIIASFAKFANQTRKVVIANGDDKNTLKAVEKCKTEVRLFGLSAGCRYSAANIRENGPFFSFDYMIDGYKVADVALSIPGKHNILNSLGVLGVADACGIPAGVAARAVSAFKGACRRFETIGKYNGFTLIDDYAHNPTELRTVITTAKLIPHRKIIAVFQPVTYSRTRLMMEGLADSLSLADSVILTPILGSREVNTYGVSSEELGKNISNCTVCQDFEQTANEIIRMAREGDIVLTLGCGDIYKVHPYIKSLSAH